MTTARGERALIGSLGAHEKWLRCDDRTAATAAARSAFQNRFVEQADPDGKMRAAIIKAGPDTARGVEMTRVLSQKIEHARKLYYKRLALASVRARQAQRGRPAEAS